MELLGVERRLQIFYRKGNGLVAEYPVDLDVDILKQAIKAMKNDELLYRPYALSQSQTKRLLKNLGLDLKIERKYYRYFLDCTGIYNKNK
jgi:hypothetical protein